MQSWIAGSRSRFARLVFEVSAELRSFAEAMWDIVSMRRDHELPDWGDELQVEGGYGGLVDRNANPVRLGFTFFPSGSDAPIEFEVSRSELEGLSDGRITEIQVKQTTWIDDPDRVGEGSE